MFQKGNKFGNRFSSENQPKNPGRKPKVFSVLKRKYGIDLASAGSFDQDQIHALLQALLSVDIRQTTTLNLTLNKDMKEIAEKLRDGEVPESIKKDEVISQVFVALSQSIAREASKGDSSTIRWIIEYLFGKATQPIESEMEVSVGADLSQLTDEELLQYNMLLEKMNKKK